MKILRKLLFLAVIAVLVPAVALMAIAYVAINLLVDILYGALDPRILR